MSDHPTEEQFHDKVAQFQRFQGLPVTGDMDEQSCAAMAQPRCGVPDVTSEDDARRKKRYAINGRVPGYEDGIAWGYDYPSGLSIATGDVQTTFQEAAAVSKK